MRLALRKRPKRYNPVRCPLCVACALCGQKIVPAGPPAEGASVNQDARPCGITRVIPHLQPTSATLHLQRTHLDEIDRRADFSAPFCSAVEGHQRTVVDCEGAGGHIRADGAHLALHGIHFTGGRRRAVGDEGARGGGSMLLVRSTVAIEDCSFTNSSVDFSGGAIFASGGTLHVKSCSLHANAAGGGGGCIWVQDAAELHLRNSTLCHCRAGTLGGAVGTLNASRVVIEDTSISRSSSRDGGGVALNSHASGVVDGCTFTGNTARGSGGAIHATGDVGRFRVTHTTMLNNSAWVNGGCINIAGAVQLTVDNCLMRMCIAAVNGGAVSLLEDADLVLGEEVALDLSEAESIGGGVYHAGASLVVEASSTPGRSRGLSIQNCYAEFGGGVGFMSPFRAWGSVSIESCTAQKDGAGLYGLGASAAFYAAGSAAAVSIDKCSAGRDGGGVALIYGAQIDLGARMCVGTTQSCAEWRGRGPAKLSLARNSAGRFGGGVFKQGCHYELDAKVWPISPRE